MRTSTWDSCNMGRGGGEAEGDFQLPPLCHQCDYVAVVAVIFFILSPPIPSWHLEHLGCPTVFTLLISAGEIILVVFF